MHFLCDCIVLFFLCLSVLYLANFPVVLCMLFQLETGVGHSHLPILHDHSVSLSHCDFAINIPNSPNPKPVSTRYFSKKFTEELVRGIILDSDRFYSTKRPCRRKFTVSGCEKYYPDCNNLTYAQKSFVHSDKGLRVQSLGDFFDSKKLLCVDAQCLCELFLISEKLHCLSDECDMDWYYVRGARIYNLRHSVVASFDEIWGKRVGDIGDSGRVVVSIRCFSIKYFTSDKFI